MDSDQPKLLFIHNCSAEKAGGQQLYSYQAYNAQIFKHGNKYRRAVMTTLAHLEQCTQLDKKQRVYDFGERVYSERVSMRCS
jgi:hypothetical protein